ncbi:MAG: ChbG/HpnK family deacetylase [Acidimicrobiales bacterium]|nr:ChbG/HpnK family deacetylase [Acidimicrobiales bacterium]
MNTRREQTRRRLIVNADDFGASEGINRGIITAHDEGIVTSTSLMVRMPATQHAASLGRERTSLSIGLHIDLTGEGTPAPADINDPAACRNEIRAQVDSFTELMQRPPSHLDAHHNIYRRSHLEEVFVELADELGVPLREHCQVRYFPDFYGQWDDGETHLEWISPQNLTWMMDHKIGPGITELSCHPGYVDQALESPYHVEREAELRSLCDPAVVAHVHRSDFELCNYDDLRHEVMAGVE